MPSATRQRARRQTAPSGPPRQPTGLAIRPGLETTQEQPSDLQKPDIPNWSNELEFSSWLNGVKDDLVEESYDQYQYVPMTVGLRIIVKTNGPTLMN